MKTKLTLLLTALALGGAAYAGPSDSAAFAIRHGREVAQANRTNTVAVTAGNGGMVTFVVPASSGKGALVTRNSDGSTNIALFKSKKSGECKECCKADANKH